ncbi:hypothetical protein [Holdemania massiliensis]|uniref:hypothetical protein n=1 Tax=Holdemania massiliensis TaxID=1468449 RepID=UPI001F061E1D|nr:hypothetical protein [Holdemania massiliensis]MCH1942433.1 hypothetical protein [Holdemania massiliensis]
MVKNLIKALVILLITFLLSADIIQAGCITVTYYSKKDWVTYYNFYDIPWSDGQEAIVNSHDKSSVVNALGTWAWPVRKGADALLGQQPYSVTRQTTDKDPYLFQASFSNLRIQQFTYDIDAFDKNGNPVQKTVLLNGYAADVGGGNLEFRGTVLQNTSSSGRHTVTIPANTDVSNIMIIFDNQNVGSTYILNYFQVDTYQIYEHVSWTTSYIEGTETRTETICTQSGVYSPDGTNGWQRSAYTTYSPAVTTVINYDPSFITREWLNYDFHKEWSWNAWQAPDNRFNVYMGGYATQITGWDWDGSQFLSRGAGGTAYPYINTGDTTGIRYIAVPMYWSTSNTGDWVADSTDRGWCQDTTGSTGHCYKYNGHTSNARLNTWDTFLQRYNNTVHPDDRYVSKVDYYLYNVDNGVEIFLKTSSEEIEKFTFEQTGRWKIKAVVYDKLGQTGDAWSKEFLIDRDKPYASFDPQPTGVYYDDLKVKITPGDDHSGVQRWKYSVSTDGGQTYSLPSNWYTTVSETVTFGISGQFVLRVDIEDKVGNVNTIYSEAYTVDKGDVGIGNLYGFSYSPNIQNNVYANITCNNCQMNTPATIKVYENGTLKKTDSVTLTNKSYTYTYPYSSAADSLQIRIQVSADANMDKDNDTLDLTVFKKTMAEKSTSGDTLDFIATTCSIVANGEPQKNIEEVLKLKLVQEKTEFFAGEGIPTAVQVQYQNNCERVENWACVAGANYNSGSAAADYIHGAEPVKYEYEKGTEYEVPLQYNTDAKAYQLPQMYAAKRSGNIYNKILTLPDEEVIPAGQKWYTDRRSVLKTYQYDVRGRMTAYNEFSWNFIADYTITENYYDQYRVRFVDPKNPFPNGDSDIWQSYESWFNNLDPNHPMKSFTIESE